MACEATWLDFIGAGGIWRPAGIYGDMAQEATWLDFIGAGGINMKRH